MTMFFHGGRLGMTALVAVLLALVPRPSAGGQEGARDLAGPLEVQRPAGVARSPFEFRLVLDKPEPGSLELPAPEGGTLVLSPRTIITQDDILKTAIGASATPRVFSVYVYFTPEAAQRMEEVSRTHRGRRIAIVMDGRIFMAPSMQGPFSSPVLIDSNYTIEEAVRIAEQLAL